jgi:PKHD-type hydroxylase
LLLEFGTKSIWRRNEYLTRPLLFPSLLTQSQCTNIVAHWDDEKCLSGEMDDAEAAYLRRGAVMWYGHETPLGEAFHALACLLVPRILSHYEFDVSSYGEQLQLCRYKDGDRLDWHVDTAAGETSLRKISLSLQLAAEDSYEGGDLEFCPGGAIEGSRKVGSMIAFPSYLAHRVTPVTSGTRYSLVTWIHGEPFN